MQQVELSENEQQASTQEDMKHILETRKGEAGVTIGELLFWLGVAAIVTGAIAWSANKALNMWRTTKTQESLLILRMQTQQLFASASDYNGLTNDMALKAGLVPQNFIKGSALFNAWGGTITLAPDSGNSAFSIAFEGIPQEECTRLATYQPEAWLSVSVNGNEANGSDVATIAESCATTNSIVYTAR